MKKIFTTSTDPLLNDIWLLFLRLGVAALMLTHGLPKLQRLMAGNAETFADPIGLGPVVSLVLVILAEVICSLLIFMGLATRLASAVLLMNMIVIVFVVHAADPFARKELGLLFLLIYLTILVFGPGRFSIDRMVSRA